MREILFKAKRTDNQEWVMGDLIHEPYGTVIQYYENEIRDIGNCAKANCKKRIKKTVIPETVCQYKGFTDKNKKKVFDADIYKEYNSKGETRIGVVSEYYEEWIIKVGKMKPMVPLLYLNYASNGDELEVIGNVFDNLELLDVQNDR